MTRTSHPIPPTPPPPTSPVKETVMARWGRTMARRRKVVVPVALVAIVLLGAISGRYGGEMTDNFSIPGVLKNATDWLSRGGSPFRWKRVGIVGAGLAGRGGLAAAFCHRYCMVCGSTPSHGTAKCRSL